MSRLIRDHLEHQGFFSTLKAIDSQVDRIVDFQKMDFNIFSNQESQAEPYFDNEES
jgi:hypothetical protein